MFLLSRCSMKVFFFRIPLAYPVVASTTQTGCRIHRTYVSLIGSGEGRHTAHLPKCVPLPSTLPTDWKQSSDVLSDVSRQVLYDFPSPNHLVKASNYRDTLMSRCARSGRLLDMQHPGLGHGGRLHP